MGRLGRLLATAALGGLAACGGRAHDPEGGPEQAASPSTASFAAVAPALASDEAEDPVPSPSPTLEVQPSTAVAEARYAPRDDCDAEVGWKSFRAKLTSAVGARDAGALAALAVPEIQLDYGGGSGVEELKKRLADSRSGLWQELERLLPLGCAVQGGLAAMPWYFWNVPEDGDPYSTMLTLGPAVPLFTRPSSKGEPVTELDWAMVAIDPQHFDPKARFSRVTTLSGKQKGYVETARLRSVIAYRLIAEPRADGWRITALIAGD